MFGLGQLGGVDGTATAPSGETIGVRGQSNSANGIGVVGIAAVTTGSVIGVRGTTFSSDGVGVEAHHSSPGGVGLRVRGRVQFATIVDGTIPAQSRSVTVSDPRVKPSSDVLVMLTGNPGGRNAVSWVDITDGRFTLNLIAPAANSVPFKAFIAEKV